METKQRASVSSMTNHYMEGETREVQIFCNFVTKVYYLIKYKNI